MKTFATLISLMLSGAFVFASDISGTIVLPNGLPAVGAQVVLVAPDRPISLGRTTLLSANYGVAGMVSGKDGGFSLQLTNDAAAIIAADESGYAEVELKDFETNSKIVLRPWGRIEGVLRGGIGYYTNQQMFLQEEYNSTTRILLNLDNFLENTDEASKFVFTHVPPGTWKVSRAFEWHGDTVTVKAGETSHITVGGTGRPIVAKLLISDKVARLNQDPIPPSRRYLKFLESEANGGGSYQIMATLYGADNRMHYAQLAPGGIIRVEDVTPGRWWLNANILKFPAEGGMAHTVATVGKEVIVPEIAGGRSDEPLDLGDLKPMTVHSPQIGEDALPFAVKTADGGTFKLADHRGQYVLLDFESWIVKTNASVEAVWQAYGGNERFTMLTLHVPPTTSYMYFNEKKLEPWPVAELEKLPWYEQEPLRASFGLQVDREMRGDPNLPAIFLVGPDGRIVRANLKGDEINAVLGRILVKN